MERSYIVLIIVLAAIFILFLIWRNVKDKNDSDPELTDELEKMKRKNREIK